MNENNFQNSLEQNAHPDQEAIMNKVNQTFDKFVQDVRNMLAENGQQEDDPLS